MVLSLHSAPGKIFGDYETEIFLCSNHMLIIGTLVRLDESGTCALGRKDTSDAFQRGMRYAYTPKRSAPARAPLWSSGEASLGRSQKNEFHETQHCEQKLYIGGTSVDEAKTKFVAIALDPFATRIFQRYTQVLHSSVSGNLLLVGL